MKKAFCFIICLSLFVCSGCNKKSSGVTAVTTGLSFTADISFYGLTTSYNVIISKDSVLEAEIISGSNKGLRCKISGNNVDIIFNGLNYSTNISSLPEGIITDFLYTAFKNANTRTVFTDDNQYYIVGDTEKYKYKIFLGLTGLPIKIEESQKDINVIIKNATVL